MHHINTRQEGSVAPTDFHAVSDTSSTKTQKSSWQNRDSNTISAVKSRESSKQHNHEHAARFKISEPGCNVTPKRPKPLIVTVACLALVGVIIATAAALILNPHALKGSTLKDAEATESNGTTLTIAHMIGEDSAELLAFYEEQNVSSAVWSDFIQQIDAEEGEVAVGPRATYRIYQVKKEEMLLSLYTMEDTTTGTLDVIYEFGPQTDVPYMTEVILMFQ